MVEVEGVEWRGSAEYRWTVVRRRRRSKILRLYTFPSPLMFLRAVDVSPVYNILTIYDKVISSLSQDRLNYDLHCANISLRNIAS